jgi:hypothetical protein
MDEQEILNQLEELAESLGIIIRYEQLLKEGSFFPGGLCKVKGENILIKSDYRHLSNTELLVLIPLSG